MFTPIDSTAVKNIKNIGNIQLRIFEGWDATAVKTTYRMVPNSVMYVNNFTKDAINLFECVISMGGSIMIIDDLNTPTRGGFLADYKTNFKAILHFYLDFAIDRMIAAAKEANKNKIIIRSALPGIASILFEKDFIVRPSDIFDRPEVAKGFKGLKKL
jgi:hypothetical protein